MSLPFRRVRTTVPPTVWLIGIVALTVIIGPLVALTVRVPWERFFEVLGQNSTKDLLIISLASAGWATIITIVLGVPLAAWLNTLRRGADLARLFVLLPLAMPPVVGGLALSAALGNRGITAPILHALGLQFAFAFPGVVLSHIFIALPFVVVSVDSALRHVDPEIQASAAGVGMSPREILWKITLPAIFSSIATGAGLAFARSLGEFGTTLTFAGSMPGVTRTMPLGIYLEREIDPDRAYVLAAILILLAFVVLLVASLPTALRRRPKPQARVVGEFDIQALRELSKPASGGSEVVIHADGETGGSSATVFPAGKTTAVVGPNGAGKTTLAGMISGRLRGAAVRVDGISVDGPDTRFVPARKRGIVLLTQKPGLPRTTTARGAITMATRDKQLTDQLLAAAGLSELADVAVSDLSGGQAAQVALVRALGARPGVLILDEPLAAIDVASASRWRTLLRAASGDRTVILITHDIIDVAGLSDHLVLIEAGSTVCQGETSRILQVPPAGFMTELSGVNRLDGIVTKVPVSPGDPYVLDVAGHSMQGVLAADLDPTAGLRLGESAAAVFAPADVTLEAVATGGDDANGSEATGRRISARNVIPGTICETDSSGMYGPVVTVRLGHGGAAEAGTPTVRVPITHQSALDLHLEVGMPVMMIIKALNITLHPHEALA